MTGKPEVLQARLGCKDHVHFITLLPLKNMIIRGCLLLRILQQSIRAALCSSLKSELNDLNSIVAIIQPFPLRNTELHEITFDLKDISQTKQKDSVKIVSEKS